MSNELMKFDEVMTLGKALAESNYFSDAKQAAQAVVKVLAGQELGIGPIAAMSGIYIIQGKVALSGNVMASLIKASPKYDYKIGDHSNTGCVIEFFENDIPVGVSEFTAEDAKRAGLTKDNWQKYPRNMMFNRALSNGAKWFCPDLFNGQAVYTQEELGDVSEEETEAEQNPPFVIQPAPELPANVEMAGDVAKAQWLKAFVANENYPADGSPLDKVNWVNAQIKEKELNIEEVKIGDLAAIEE